LVVVAHTVSLAPDEFSFHRLAKLPRYSCDKHEVPRSMHRRVQRISGTAPIANL
jgi:hypothetical protein